MEPSRRRCVQLVGADDERPEAACEFYGTLFGWKVETMDMGSGPYHVLKVGDAAVGGIMGKPPGTRRHAVDVGLLRHGADVDETLAKVKSLAAACDGADGGQGRRPHGVIQDPQGATLSVIAYSV